MSLSTCLPEQPDNWSGNFPLWTGYLHINNVHLSRELITVASPGERVVSLCNLIGSSQSLFGNLWALRTAMQMGLPIMLLQKPFRLTDLVAGSGGTLSSEVGLTGWTGCLDHLSHQRTGPANIQ